jgi:hypothetical protein
MAKLDYELYLEKQEARLAKAWNLEGSEQAPHTDSADLVMALSQTRLNREQLSLINEQVSYTRTIKRATIAMTWATIIMAIATCVLAFK